MRKSIVQVSENAYRAGQKRKSEPPIDSEVSPLLNWSQLTSTGEADARNSGRVRIAVGVATQERADQIEDEPAGDVAGDPTDRIAETLPNVAPQGTQGATHAEH
jgi:hypothetical protein